MPDPPYASYRDIWLQEFDAENLTLVGEQTLLWNGALKEAECPEAPNIYKVDGTYYLLIAEGGTYHDHAVTIARSDNVSGPYTGNPRNPILTHRHLGLEHPISNPGHADIVETQNGEWWMVALASRPYGGYFYNLGRETFLARVVWEDGWPIVNPGRGCIECQQTAPDLPAYPMPPVPACDHFDSADLALCWNFLRTPRTDFWSLTERPGFLRLQLRRERLADLVNPSFVGRRQTDIDFAAQVNMSFSPRDSGAEAGLVLLQNNDHHFRFVSVLEEGGAVIRLIRRKAGDEEVLGTCPASSEQHFLKVEAVGQAYSFFHALAPEEWVPVAVDVDGRLLSTQVAGGLSEPCWACTPPATARLRQRPPTSTTSSTSLAEVPP